MDILEARIRELLEKPVSILVEEAEALRVAHGEEYGKCHVSGEVLQQLHRKIRGHSGESKVWDAILFHLDELLPVAMAHDLIDRDICVVDMGHTRQCLEIQWRLATLVEEALLTLFLDIYRSPDRGNDELHKLLELCPNDWWLVDRWQYWAELASSPEKELIFQRWVWEHPRRPVDFPNPEQYAEIMAQRERDKREALLMEQRKAEAREREVEEKMRLWNLELKRIAESPLSQSEFESIWAEKEPEVLLALAANANVPLEWIQKLSLCYNVKGTRQIREVAMCNLQLRAETKK